MPKSSVSDFEQFSLKVEKHISAKVKKSKEMATSYQTQKKQESEDASRVWLEQKCSEWEYELNAREQQEKRVIANEAGQKWSLFVKRTEAAVRKALQQALQKQFPSLAECFVSWVSEHYKTGTFIIPEAYSIWVDRERFEVQISQEEKIIFRSDNLYIEYSIERIIEELKEEISAVMHYPGSKEDTWPV